MTRATGATSRRTGATSRRTGATSRRTGATSRATRAMGVTMVPAAILATLSLAAAAIRPPPSAADPAAPGPSLSSSLQHFLNVPYDGSYTFVRVRFNSFRRRSFSPGFGRGGGPGWAHDYPYADDNFIKILDEVTLLGPNTEGTNVIDAEDPEIHRYPIAYVSEPGEWSPSQAEVDNLTAYLRKGGFLILDDFRGIREWQNVEAIFRVMLPDHRFRPLVLEEPIFNAFFQIETLDLPPPTFQQYRPAVSRAARGRRPAGPADGHRQLQQRHRGLLGVLGHGVLPDRSF